VKDSTKVLGGDEGVQGGKTCCERGEIEKIKPGGVQVVC